MQTPKILEKYLNKTLYRFFKSSWGREILESAMYPKLVDYQHYLVRYIDRMMRLIMTIFMTKSPKLREELYGVMEESFRYVPSEKHWNAALARVIRQTIEDKGYVDTDKILKNKYIKKIWKQFSINSMTDQIHYAQQLEKQVPQFIDSLSSVLSCRIKNFVETL